MCQLAWGWNKALNDCIRLLSFFSTVLPSKVRGRLSFWVHKFVLQYIISHYFILLLLEVMVKVTKMFSDLLQNLKCDTTASLSEFNVWIHKRGVKCNTLGLLTQFEILALPAQQVHTNEPRRTEQEPTCTADVPVGRLCKKKSPRRFTQLSTIRLNN